MTNLRLGLAGTITLLALLGGACTSTPPSGTSAATKPTLASRIVFWEDCPGATGLMPATPSLPACVAQSGAKAAATIKVGLGDSPAKVGEASSFAVKFDMTDMFFTDTPVNVDWVSGQRHFVFEDVGGTGQSVLALFPEVENSGENRGVGSISFDWQNRPLNLSEVVARSQRLQTWLLEAGYVQLAGGRDIDRPFVVTGDEAQPRRHANDWAGAEALLASSQEDVVRMLLYAVASGDTVVSVTAKNWRRGAANFGKTNYTVLPPKIRKTIFDGTGDYEWALEIYISNDRYITPAPAQ